jgi:hypothetical protein
LQMREILAQVDISPGRYLDSSSACT